MYLIYFGIKFGDKFKLIEESRNLYHTIPFYISPTYITYCL